MIFSLSFSISILLQSTKIKIFSNENIIEMIET